jgi:hypothetical protein
MLTHACCPDAFIVDMELRRAEPPDAIAVARVHIRSWQAAYCKLMPDDYLDQLCPEDRAKKHDFGNLDPLRPYTIVPTESGRILGFATTAPTQGSPCQITENSVPYTSTPTTGAEALALHLCRQHVPGFSIWDFEMRFSGCLRATSGQSAFSSWPIHWLLRQ